MGTTWHDYLSLRKGRNIYPGIKYASRSSYHMEQENMKSLAKTFSILDLYLHGKDELSVTEISNTLGLNKATVSRILSKLVKHGYLRQMGKRGKFSLGPIFLEFSGIVKRQLKLRDVAIPYLYELNRLVKESVIIAVWDKREAILRRFMKRTILRVLQSRS
jgi:DNA-binding IclR family transcriptional regulator